MAKQEHSSTIDLHYGHPRMSLADRAKIFIPFDPLKGFREALAEQERLAAAQEAEWSGAETDAVPFDGEAR